MPDNSSGKSIRYNNKTHFFNNFYYCYTIFNLVPSSGTQEREFLLFATELLSLQTTSGTCDIPYFLKTPDNSTTSTV